jgi:hypothetical protein
VPSVRGNRKTPPHFDKPIPITVIRSIAVSAMSNVVDAAFHTASDMIIIAFFFLLRPGEYTDNDGNPFRLEDAQLFIGDTRLPLMTAPESKLHLARFASLTFTCRKPPSYVPYKCTYVPYNSTFGASDQGQTLDV